MCVCVCVYKRIMFVYKVGRSLYAAGISISKYNMKLDSKVKELLTSKNDG